MVPIFDIEKLRGLLKDFYEICHIRITVSDANRMELVSYPSELVAPYCRIIRETEKGREACHNCDVQAYGLVSRTHSTHVYQCHAGLTEAITPLYVGNVLTGYLIFGHVFVYPDHETGWNAVREKCRDLDIDENRLRETLMDAIPTEKAFVESAAHILHAVASYLILERMVTLNEDLVEAEIDSYIEAHFTEKINASMISKQLRIGKTQLYELSNRLYGCGIAEKIRTMRMEKAKELLSGQRILPLADVAEQCGYSDYNYFITVFRREVGMTPAQWRRKQGVAPR